MGGIDGRRKSSGRTGGLEAPGERSIAGPHLGSDCFWYLFRRTFGGSGVEQEAGVAPWRPSLHAASLLRSGVRTEYVTWYWY